MTTARELLDSDFATVAQMVAAHARERADQLALADDTARLTYADLDRMITRIAAGLHRDLAGRPSTVAILGRTCVADVAVLLGALRAGMTPVLISPSSTPAQVATMLADSAATIVFVDPAHTSSVDAGATPVVWLDALDAWCAPGSAPIESRPIKPDDRFNIIYSSGTTGTPKGIVHTHGTRWTQAIAWTPLGFDQAVSLIATPLCSNTTLGCALLPTLVHGGTVILLGKFDPRRYLETAERERVTHSVLVPVQYQRIMADPEFDRFDLSTFVLKIVTGAPFAADAKADVVRRWPGELLEIYGMTEGGGVCTLYATQYPEKLHTVGSPAPGTDIRLIDEDGREVAPGEIGEVVGRSGIMMQGYHGRHDATGAAEWFDADGNRFLRHGDLARFDADGFLTLLGRSKDMIISGGFNVYPIDIEAVAAQHPDIVDVAVIGVPSATWGETPFAFFVPRADAAIDNDSLLAWINARVGKTQRLGGAAAIDTLPRNAMGKVLKRDLRDHFITTGTAA
ncbi:class I adenylate-forming enzyme family protein [Hephaestia sp. GCM10023244]|uniref:class I adenylate-forming enzyme family protein n=1 Tax=unclassified Hephaestia TaxID=2631281 RepID=UPI002077124C|nr:class I adenylate-forming enzyme family protein [Hephaestia sp. MAHUQ-44]MCM8732484.1 acyl--CoA ligase [Hephaestia sp. MAHUQ-44]